MKSIWSDGNTLLIVKTKFHTNINLSILSRRAYRLVLVMSQTGKWGKEITLLTPFNFYEYTFPLFCPETGFFIGYKLIEE